MWRRRATGREQSVIQNLRVNVDNEGDSLLLRLESLLISGDHQRVALSAKRGGIYLESIVTTANVNNDS